MALTEACYPNSGRSAVDVTEGSRLWSVRIGMWLIELLGVSDDPMGSGGQRGFANVPFSAEASCCCCCCNGSGGRSVLRKFSSFLLELWLGSVHVLVYVCVLV